MKKFLISIICILLSFFIGKDIFENALNSEYGISDIELKANPKADLALDYEKEVWALNSSLNNRKIDTFIPFSDKEIFSPNLLDSKKYAEDFKLMCLYRKLIMDRVAENNSPLLIEITNRSGFVVKYPLKID